MEECMSERHRNGETVGCIFCHEPVSADSANCPQCGAALSQRDAAPIAERASSATVGDVTSMLEQGRRIDAVRVYREQTGAGQREATLAVEALGRVTSAPATRTYASPASRDANLKADLWALIQNGQKIEAIQLYRQRTGESMKTAKDVVEALAREHGVVPARAGCFGLILLCLAFPTLLVFLVAR